MSLKLRFHRDAEAELRAAIARYEFRRPGLGAQLLKASDEALDLIQKQPAIGTTVSEWNRTNVRRFLVSRFPYQVVYLILPETLVIVAVAHLKRRPGYWKDRL